MTRQHAPFGGIYMGAPEWLLQQQQQNYEMPAPEYRAPPGSSVARAIESVLAGAAEPVAALGRGAWDIISTPRRVAAGEISPTGPEASRFGLSAVPTLGMFMSATDLASDVGGALRRNKVGFAGAAEAANPYEADEKAIADLRAERRRIEGGSLGPRAKRESLEAIDRQIGEAMRALGERKGRDFDTQRTAKAEEDRLRREEEVATKDASRRKAESERPFRERQPEISDALNKGGLLAASLIGLRAGVRNQAIENSQAKKLDTLNAKEAAAKDAARRGEPGGWDDLAAVQNQLKSQHEVYANFKPDYIKPAFAGAAAAGVPPSAPELIDMGMPTGTAAKENAVKQLTDGTYWGQKLAFGAAGAGLAEAGLFGGMHAVPKRVPDQSRALSLEMDKPVKAAALAKDAAIAEKAGQDFLKIQESLARNRESLAEAQRRSGAQVVDADPAAGFGAVRPGLSGANQSLPGPLQLPPPAAPSQNPSSPPTQTGLTIPETITAKKTRINKSYGEQTSPDMQAYVLGKAEAGIPPDALSKAQVARDLAIKAPNRANNALNNLIEIARANRLDISDPNVLRALIAELNGMPAYRNSRGTGNSLFSAPLVPLGAPSYGDTY